MFAILHFKIIFDIGLVVKVQNYNLEAPLYTEYDVWADSLHFNSLVLGSSDRGSIRPGGGHGALHGLPAIALAGSFSVTQSEEQQSWGGQCSRRAHPIRTGGAAIYYRSTGVRLAPRMTPQDPVLITERKEALQKSPVIEDKATTFKFVFLILSFLILGHIV